ncbi:L,D-transpeptidase family protein [Streptomyces sp. PTM05]|uniref:L,D-transpeptidase family protein n=1 Tax=Streptantibioticus parmotrematis TaxID=2873249 RepID=A0ABS7QLM7_9ACTN|nr:L,D-transpeptidase [Streptantibioticus parmotrematis]MBY8883833.1 L,D-transpeptidase family protein [Streptantibioticus parmotrematis]
MAGVTRARGRAGLLAAATLLPVLLTGGTASAGSAAGPGAPGGADRAAIGSPKHRPDEVVADDVVPLDRLVPGEPLPAAARDTPDQGLAPGDPAPARGRAVPAPAQARDAALIEWVPADDAAAVRAAAEPSPAPRPARRPYCSAHTGPYQTEVERFLHLFAGTGHARQTPDGCSAIRRYQRAHAIRPAIGFAGPVTWGSMLDAGLAAELASKAPANPDAGHHCPVGRYRIACVDQNRQLMWVQQGRRILFGPVRVRTGKTGMRTRDGLYRVYWRHEYHVSTIYGTPMPYSQFFDGGEAFHGIYGSLYAPTGSYGCVNLRVADARRLWGVLRKGDRVYVWGHKPR